MDTSKKNQAVQIIAGQIGKLPANAKAEYGTAGAAAHMTRREAEAHSMAKYVVTRMGGKFSGTLPENYTAEERESSELLKEIAAAALAITGK